MLKFKDSYPTAKQTYLLLSDSLIQEVCPVNLAFSVEFRGDSSSDHLSWSSPTAKIVSPSNDGLPGAFSLTGFGGTGES